MNSIRRSVSRRLCSASAVYSDVLFESVGCNRRVTLNRPDRLNAITYRMILQLRQNLTEFESDPSLGVVVIKGAGDRAFCAGGDVHELRRAAMEDDLLIRSYCYDEYTTNYLIRTYRKPYIALLDGITMGAGVGMSCHGRFRVATEHSQFAMPETAIGLFPDCGASHILSRINGRMGMWLGLTSHSLSSIDVKRYGVATHFCERRLTPKLERTILALKKSDCTTEKVNEILSDFDSCSHIPNNVISEENEEVIAHCFSADSVEEVLQRLGEDGSKFAMNNLKTLNERSPLALKLAHEQISRAASLSLHEVFTMEHRLVRRIFTDGGGDFVEGVRAMIVDKDRRPKWSPSTLAQVSRDQVLSYFQPLEYPERDLHLRVIT